MTINSKDFRVPEGEGVNLKMAHVDRSGLQVERAIREIVGGSRGAAEFMQQLHYATNRHAILLIFQAMDAAGARGADVNCCLSARGLPNEP